MTVAARVFSVCAFPMYIYVPEAVSGKFQESSEIRYLRCVHEIFARTIASTMCANRVRYERRSPQRLLYRMYAAHRRSKPLERVWINQKESGKLFLLFSGPVPNDFDQGS